MIRHKRRVYLSLLKRVVQDDRPGLRDNRLPDTGTRRLITPAKTRKIQTRIRFALWGKGGNLSSLCENWLRCKYRTRNMSYLA